MNKFRAFQLNHPELWSIFLTFGAAFGSSVLASVIALDNPAKQVLEAGVAVGIFSAAARAAFKLTVNGIILLLERYISSRES